MSDLVLCRRCKMLKAQNDFTPDKKSKSGLRYYCKACGLEYGRAWRERNPGYMQRYYARHPEKKTRSLTAEQLARRREAEKCRYRKDSGKRLERQNKHAAQLTDYYVALSMGLKKIQCTPELLAMKREQLLARRLARQLKKAADESSKDPH